MRRDWKTLCRLADEETRALLADLPAPLREKVGDMPISFETWADDELVDAGYDPDLMGLFEGASLRDPEGPQPELPPRIRLFLESILEEADGEERAFRREVRTTLLHELGHYLGLDEGELVERDLE